MRKLLLTVIVTDPKRFIPKSKPVICTEALVELYKKKNHEQVHEIYGIVELKKICLLSTKNPRYFSTCSIIEISLVLCSAYVVFKDQDKIVFYIYKEID